MRDMHEEEPVRPIDVELAEDIEGEADFKSDEDCELWRRMENCASPVLALSTNQN